MSVDCKDRFIYQLCFEGGQHHLVAEIGTNWEKLVFFFSLIISINDEF